MNDDEERGLKALYDMLVKAAEFPGENSHSPASLTKWHNQLEYLHGIMLQFYSQDLIKRYDALRKEIKSLPVDRMGDAALARGYDLCFRLLGVISKAFIQENLVLENPMGTRIVYDMFVHISLFPRQNLLTISTILQWFDKIRAMHYILEGYLEQQFPQFLREHGIIIRQLKECSKLYPSDDYVLKSREWLINWAGMLSRVLQEKNLLIPEELSFSDRIGTGGGEK